MSAAFAHAGRSSRRRAAGSGRRAWRSPRFGRDPAAAAAGAAAPPRHAAALPRLGRRGRAAEAAARRYASPSRAGEDVPSPAALAAGGSRAGLGRFRRGDLIHRLLQLLPDLPPASAARGGRRARLLAASATSPTPSGAGDGRRGPRGAGGPALRRGVRPGQPGRGGHRRRLARSCPTGWRSPAGSTGWWSLPDRVLVADFKTNRPSPDRIEDADPAYLHADGGLRGGAGRRVPRPAGARRRWSGPTAQS